jgi:hydroxymethylbilane synthase
LRYKADFAVHSLKDLHAGISNRLVVACIPKRETPNDIFINNFDNSPIGKLKAGSIIGTSSIRRALQIKAKYPSLIVKAIRGNIETRINKSKENHYGGIILAEAGIKRMGLRNTITQRLSTQSFVPAPGQGALAIVCRKDDVEIIKTIKKIEDGQSRNEIMAERALIDIIGAGCTVPVGALAKTNKEHNIMYLHVAIYSLDGKKIIKHKEQGDAGHPETLGKKAGEALISKGALELTKEWVKNNNINSSPIKEFIINE